MTDTEINLLYLDDYHAGDVLFVQSLARSLARMTPRHAILIHGSGEHAERALEAQGIFREREGGLLPVASAEEHTLVERAIRHVNRKITGVLTDAVVPAVSVIGSERGLLRVRDAGLSAENVSWLTTLVMQGVVPVVASYAIDDAGGTGEVPMHAAAAVLARELRSSIRVVIFTKTNLPGIMRGGATIANADMKDLDEHIAAKREDVAALVSAGFRVLLTNTTRLSDSEGAAGTLIRTST